ncbi:uncharacterized protein N7483_002540 [Penicillium malachiteum]|uniref:uncharacterized protein n=1 Tax=Penicillium malachiteum TaxID=1324776 RepID=UPI0025484A8A|nr:uncharacterized protein N7483_002540 [Penicillium malachiteum]KAJ5737415.1 hypothetical protein N7483_002540 [Penicillium malachiteum]
MAIWLDLVEENGDWTAVETRRLEKLVRELPFPQCQQPSLIYFAGNSNRIKALKALFPHNNVTRKGAAGLVRLHLSLHTEHTNNPVLLAESSLGVAKTLGDSRWLKHMPCEHQKWKIAGARHASLSALQEDVKRQLVLPWTQIVCLFLDSDGDFRSAESLFRQPSRSLTVGNMRIPSSMQVVVIVSKPGNEGSITERCASLEKFVPSNRFSMLDLRQRSSLSDAVAFGPLHQMIFEKLSETSLQEQSSHRRFSALHLSAFWNASLESYRFSVHEAQLDVLSKARANFPTPPSMNDCLCEAARMVTSSGYGRDELEHFFASAFLMDTYPPEMHGFAPTLVFSALYGKDRLHIWRGDLKSHWEGILSRFEQLFTQMGDHNRSAAIRRSTLGRLFGQKQGLYSTTVCLCCLLRPPEHMMPCQHALCDTCLVIFGMPSPLGEYHTTIAECPICSQKANITIRQLPPTKHPVILSLDGGGIRGIVQLGLLRVLEGRIGIPIASLPDLCVGTSVGRAGALIAIDLFLNPGSVEGCFYQFPQRARKIFHRSTATTPRLLRIMASALNLSTHGLYDSERLSETVKEVTGPGRRLFDTATVSPAGCRVAFVTSRTADGKAVVLANYRGSGQRNADAAYEFLVPRSNEENPPLPDAGACSTAAPIYFDTINLPGFAGSPFQDGGVRANNPLAIAWRESTILWPAARRPDLLVSVGTGFSPAAPSRATGLLKRLREGALPRLIRATLSSPTMDGDQGFREALNYLSHRPNPNVFRVDHEIDGTLPELDDVCSLEMLSQRTFVVADELVRAVLASAALFFELDDIPTQRHAGLHCQGSILCARPDAAGILRRVLVEIPEARFQAGQSRQLGPVDVADCCHFCGYFRRRVEFVVASLDEGFTIEIANHVSSQKIGGFPKSAREFLEDQQAFARFGRADHQVSRWPPVRQCHCAQGMKRKIRFTELTLPGKRDRPEPANREKV